MTDANYFREWAQRCRALAQIASQSEVMYQLEVWAMEFDRYADQAEILAVEPEDPNAPRRSWVVGWALPGHAFPHRRHRNIPAFARLRGG